MSNLLNIIKYSESSTIFSKTRVVAVLQNMDSSSFPIPVTSVTISSDLELLAAYHLNDGQRLAPDVLDTLLTRLVVNYFLDPITWHSTQISMLYVLLCVSVTKSTYENRGLSSRSLFTSYLRRIVDTCIDFKADETNTEQHQFTDDQKQIFDNLTFIDTAADHFFDLLSAFPGDSTTLEEVNELQLHIIRLSKTTKVKGLSGISIPLIISTFMEILDEEFPEIRSNNIQ